MKKFFKDIALAAVIGFAVGALVALVAPAIATLALGSAAAAGGMASPMFMGLFAASWGAFGAAVTPAVTYLANKFSRNKSSYSQDISASSPVNTMSEALDMDMVQNGKFAQMIDAEKARSVEIAR